MKLKIAMLATLMALGVNAANAGQFVSLTSGNGTNLTLANGGLINGANSLNADKFYIENLASTTYLTGYEYGSDNGTIASTLNYRAYTGANSTFGTLTLVDYKITENVALLPGIPQATIFDYVYRDSLDGKLVFGTRYMNLVDNDQEVNYLYRQGAGGNVSTSWTFLSDYDLRMYQAGQTNDITYNSSVSYVDGIVRQKADISVSEGNPWSGLYLVKTDAVNYGLGANAIGYYQAGEEGQAVVGGFLTGFIATPVPEAESYALMMAGLGVVGVATRRRKSK
ncbi:PEP-CTERM sorting domain-containing protein [Methylophilus sp. 5]|uniref:PEP-CTERM sorting domain-containing protein n=1 Tax=Methylophilus sp. 5 TaxID=1112274 RepID=UPI000491FE2F|nr:PEP-CTERM sorting domain-containing protein [Methylophilus sp. 5]